MQVIMILQRVERRLLGLAHKIAQLWQALLKNRHAFNQDS